MRRLLIAVLVLVASETLAADAMPAGSAERPPFSVVEATISQLQAAMESGQITSREIVLQYLTRIAIYEDKLNAIITVNPKALEEAEALDPERAKGKIR